MVDTKSCIDRSHTDCTMLLTLPPSSLSPLVLKPEPIEASHSRHTQHDTSLAALPRTHGGCYRSGSHGLCQPGVRVSLVDTSSARMQIELPARCCKSCEADMLVHIVGGRHTRSSQCATDRHCSLWPQLATADQLCLASIQSELKLSEFKCKRHLARDESMHACMLSAAAVRMTCC